MPNMSPEYLARDLALALLADRAYAVCVVSAEDGAYAIAADSYDDADDRLDNATRENYFTPGAYCALFARGHDGPIEEWRNSRPMYAS